MSGGCMNDYWRSKSGGWQRVGHIHPEGSSLATYCRCGYMIVSHCVNSPTICGAVAVCSPIVCATSTFSSYGYNNIGWSNNTNFGTSLYGNYLGHALYAGTNTPANNADIFNILQFGCFRMYGRKISDGTFVDLGWNQSMFDGNFAHCWSGGLAQNGHCLLYTSDAADE